MAKENIIDKAVNNVKGKRKFGKIVEVLGHTVREGTKKHSRLLADKKHYDDLAKHENTLPTGHGLK